ncbi:uncharacterized protein E5676_scaffold49G00600 [Cucumis melo var. makuwa]|uniref:Uncharacterized protein LOC103497198 n=2 Tax=Cucumis melo TaxID=3656 RepID=A0A1S3C6E2_CUCME|nr:uncharacterized protein LOC103497198 [Cucumis melo]KAA0033889.1 uncharacterized protein E6C27_scaffold43059G00740 [Cucumis melo var. makuwa]TYK01273.1 uncharacterized protein E5676_scaffold49G00600 [Cucumis melo var. makuwa]
MTRMLTFLFCLSSFTFLSVARADGRAPHGLVYESPVAFSPMAYDFFHPSTQNPNGKDPCGDSKCSPLPLAAQVQSTPARESKYSTTIQNSKHRVGAGGILGIVFGITFAVFLAMGVYYVLRTRQANANRAMSAAQPSA